MRTPTATAGRTVSVFADHLNLATSPGFREGRRVGFEARHFLFLRGHRRGWQSRRCGKLSCQAGAWAIPRHAEFLNRGFDNWLYGAVGYSNFPPEKSATRNSRSVRGIFRFRPDGSALNSASFNSNTWGFGLNAAGDVFWFHSQRPSDLLRLSARLHSESDPTGLQPTWWWRGGGFRQGYRLDDNNSPRKGAAGATASSAKSLAPGMRMHPNTPMSGWWTTSGLHGRSRTRLHGQRRATRPPAGKALVTEPTAKLIGIVNLTPEGGGYKASDGGNLLASTDEWMSPIFAEVRTRRGGPVIDFQLHHPAQSDTEPPIRGVPGHDRTGRCLKTDHDLGTSPTDAFTGWCGRMDPKPDSLALSREKPAELIAALDSGNQFWALTAQRLIVDNALTNLAPALKKRVRSADAGTGAIMHCGPSRASEPWIQNTHRQPSSPRTPHCAATRSGIAPDGDGTPPVLWEPRHPGSGPDHPPGPPLGNSWFPTIRRSRRSSLAVANTGQHDGSLPRRFLDAARTHSPVAGWGRTRSA